MQLYLTARELRSVTSQCGKKGGGTAIDSPQWSTSQTTPSNGGISPNAPPDHMTMLQLIQCILRHLKYTYLFTACVPAADSLKSETSCP